MESIRLLIDKLLQTKNLAEKECILRGHRSVCAAIESGGDLIFYFLRETDLGCRVVFLSLVAIGQHRIVFFDPQKKLSQAIFHSLLSSLVPVEHFYASIGGLVGYFATFMEKAQAALKQTRGTKIRKAEGISLDSLSHQVRTAIEAGLHALSEMAMIIPLGGLGSRLSLKDKKGNSLPTACLPFLGLSLLEIIVREIQAAEYLYFKLFGNQITVPIALMASKTHSIEDQIHALCVQKNWFGRPQESLRLFSQISVPVIAQDGTWSMLSPLVLNLQPGGHGALWRTAEENGIFKWFQKLGCTQLLVRQINNPIAGVDYGLLAFVGVGKLQKKAFGFASCQRKAHAAEGILVWQQREGRWMLCNIEYTDFKLLGIEDLPDRSGYSVFPSNTNLIYADLEKLLPLLHHNPLPGLMVNLKSIVPVFGKDGERTERKGGRLESMMQSMSEILTAPEVKDLPTYLTFNARRRTIAATKRQRQPEKSLLETPEGAFYDCLLNHYELLRDHCHVSLPAFSSEEEYIKDGPSLLFLYHPALGPFFEIIGQKIRRGSLAWGSELQLDIADILIESLHLSGSLMIEADHIMGHPERGRLCYSAQTGKCILKNVSVCNRGIDRESKASCYWKNRVKRHESLHIHLKGNSEFYAEEIAFHHGLEIVVPNGQRWTACQRRDGSLYFQKEWIEGEGWSWSYSLKEGRTGCRLSHTALTR